MAFFHFSPVHAPQTLFLLAMNLLEIALLFVQREFNKLSILEVLSSRQHVIPDQSWRSLPWKGAAPPKLPLMVQKSGKFTS